LQWILDIRKILCSLSLSPTPFCHTISTKVHVLPACGIRCARESESYKTRRFVWLNSIRGIQTPRLSVLWIDCVQLRHAFIGTDHCTSRRLCFLLILISFMIGKPIVSHTILTYIDTLLILRGVGSLLYSHFVSWYSMNCLNHTKKKMVFSYAYTSYVALPTYLLYGAESLLRS